MFVYPIFGGCKYTNNFLFINKNIEFQRLGMLITPSDNPQPSRDNRCYVFCQIRCTVIAEMYHQPEEQPPLCSHSGVSVHSDSENKDKTMKTATTVQTFGHFSVQW